MFSKKYVLNALLKHSSARSTLIFPQALVRTFTNLPKQRLPSYFVKSSYTPYRCFSTATTNPTDDFLSSTGSSQKRITTRTLCEITGTKYYLHNSEIGFHPDRKVKVFDENDVLVGELTFSEALASAQSAKKDLVLRNDKSEPPVCKIMLYKMELLKKLFKKLGKQHTEEKETKAKTIRLTTTIAVHDLENKKRKALEYLKQFSILKFYMKVNIYDEENVQKGRLMLMNIAEDLKEYATIKVSRM